MKQLILSLALLVLNGLVAEHRFETISLNNGHTIALSVIHAPEDTQVMDDAEKLFIRSFIDCYNKFTPEQLYLKDTPNYLESFLKEVFEDERADFINNRRGTTFVVARDLSNGSVIGFVGIDKSSHHGQDVLYIRQLAVEPSCNKQGIGKALVLSTAAHLIDAYPAQLTVGTRHINTNAIAFYEHLGFIKTNITEVHHELPGFKYQGFYKIVESR